MSATTRPARLTGRTTAAVTTRGTAHAVAAAPRARVHATTAPAASVPAARHAPQPLWVAPPPRVPLTVVTAPQIPSVRPARTPFVGLVVVLIVAGLMALLTLNTALQQASFTVSRLERQAADLTGREQALAQQVAVEEAPQRLAQRAAELGMVPSETPAFIRAADGSILGVPVPGKEPVPEPVPEPGVPPASPDAVPGEPSTQGSAPVGGPSTSGAASAGAEADLGLPSQPPAVLLGEQPPAQEPGPVAPDQLAATTP